MNSTVISILSGISSLLGLLAVLAYFVSQLQARRAERSVREIVGQDSLFADQVVEILKQFDDDKLRLGALEVLADHEGRQAKNLLDKIKNNVDIDRLNVVQLQHRQVILKWSGAALVVLGGIGLVYSVRTDTVARDPDGQSSELPTVSQPKPVIKSYIEPESTAREILSTVTAAESWRRDRVIRDLFLDHWVKPPGWLVRVEALPERDDDACNFLVAEQGTNARILATGTSLTEGCKLRPGQAVRLTGRVTAAAMDMITISDVIVDTSPAPAPTAVTRAGVTDREWQRVETIHAPGAMTWGEWGDLAWCSRGAYAVGFRTKIETRQGDGESDDTAMNGVELLCRDASSGQESPLRATEGQWGEWTEWAKCEPGFMLASYTLRSEPKAQHDDTAANGIRFGCRSTESNELATAARLKVSNEGYWGSFGQEAHCPSRSAICALKTRVQGSLGRLIAKGKDDTALNDVSFECCSY